MQQLAAHEKPLAKVFCGDYDFRIPNYQRPYAWGNDQAAELLNDLSDALDRDEDEPYFLGSLVLIKDPREPAAEVIDGQQRLTTLTILFSALAALEEDATNADLYRQHIIEKGNALQGLSSKPRLELRPKDSAFFKKYIQEALTFDAILGLDPNQLTTDSQLAIRSNALLLHERLAEWSAERRFELGKLLVNRTYLVVVSTPDLASAHRIFSVMNARGLDLSPADVFKAEVIGEIPDNLREAYAHKWENAEESLGRADFADLFLHIRMVFGRRRGRHELLKEFPEQVLNDFRPGKMTQFVDDELVPFTRADREIRDADYTHESDLADSVNAWFRRLVQLDNNDWRPPALWALRYHHGDPVFLDQFLRKLERLAASLLLQRIYTTPRVDRYAQLLRDLGTGSGLDARSFELDSGERELTWTMLDGDIYHLPPRVRRYLLLRLDGLISADDGMIQQPKYATIEHVLPQNPPQGSQWRRDFASAERAEWTHRLANLVLLNKQKNSEAANYEFEVKKNSYFTGKSGITTYALTTSLMACPEWTPDVLAARQADLLKRLSTEWGLY
jgi:hypothetical protein